MVALIGLGYFALDGALAGILARRGAPLSFVSGFFLMFCAGFLALYLMVLVGLPLGASFAFICFVKLAALLWRFYDLISLLREERPPGLIWIVLFLLVTTQLVAAKGLLFWDDWGNWGLFAKILWFSDGLPDPARQGTFFDYFLLQSYYWSAFHFGVLPFEERLGPAITWLVFAIGMLRFVRHHFAYIFIVLLTTFLFPSEYFAVTYTDGMLAIAFALLAVEVFEWLEGEGSLLAVIGPLLLLLFAKPAGFYLAIIAVIALILANLIAPLVSGLFSRDDAPAWSWQRMARLCGVILILAALKFALVKIFLATIGAREAQQFSRTLTEAYAAGYLDAFWRAVRNLIFVHDRMLFVLPVLLLANLVFLPFSIRARHVIFFFLASAGNFVFILVGTLLFFSEQEITRAASFTRYMEHTYILAYVLLLGSGAKIHAHLREAFQLSPPGRPALVLSALVAYAAVYFFGGFAFYHYRHPLLKATIETARACAEHDGRFLTVSQNDSGFFFHVSRLYIYPQELTGEWQFCPGDTDSEGNRCSATPNREAWIARLRGWNVERILLVKDDEYLKQELWPEAIPYPERLPACVDIRALHNQP